jgi:hypothetical protein
MLQHLVRLYTQTSLNLLVTNFLFNGNYNSFAYVNASSLTIINVQIDSFTEYLNDDVSPINLMTGGCNFTMINSIISNCGGGIFIPVSSFNQNITIIGSRFYLNGDTVDTNSPSISLYTSSSSQVSIIDNTFIGNAGDILLGTLSSPVTITGNSFFRNPNNVVSSTDYAVKCGTGLSSVFTQYNNFFCGVSGNILSGCSSTIWNGTVPPVLSPSDSCGVCLGDNSEKDCTGTCFGTNTTSCLTSNSYYVALNGSDSNTGSSFAHAFQTIQKGLNTANTNDVVYVQNGVYPITTSLNFNGKGITLRSLYGESGADNVVLDCQGGYGPAFNVSSGETLDSKIIGITMKSCLSNAIIVINNSSVTLISSTFKNNSNIGGGGFGGAMGIGYSSLVVATNCYFLNNTQYNDHGTQGGGAIMVYNSSGLVLRQCKFFNNQADYDGSGPGNAILVYNSSAIINGSIFGRNEAYSTGPCGDVDISNSAVELNQNSFYSDGMSGVNQYTSFYSTVAPAYTYSSNAGTGNVYCGNYTAIRYPSGINSGLILFTANLTHDSCLLCGGSGSEIDCTGTCWGTAVLDSNSVCCSYTVYRSNGNICPTPFEPIIINDPIKKPITKHWHKIL